MNRLLRTLEHNLNTIQRKLSWMKPKIGDKFTNVFLIGPAQFVFKGVIEI